jgi:peptidylprolyl isomerase
MFSRSSALRMATRRVPTMPRTSCVVSFRSFHSTHLLMGVDRTVLKAGTGATPTKGQTVTVHCTGFLADGKKKFWSTKDTNEPFSFKVGMSQVIRGWDDGVMQMQIGECAELNMTGDFAYGPKGFPAWGIPPNAALIFEIDLLKAQ